MTDYKLLSAQIAALGQQEGWYVPLLANASAAVWQALPDINWAGFYVMRDGQLVLGPFQGKVACIHIQPPRGVCGTAAAEDRTMVVPDVHAFPGHIACDSASRSEIVIPLRRGGKVAAVLDIDSPLPDRFSPEDAAGLERLVRLIESKVEFPDETL